MTYIQDRLLNEGEVCALELNKIGNYSILRIEENNKNIGIEEENLPNFIANTTDKLSKDKKGITLVKYLGAGLLLDLFSGEIIHMEIYMNDDITYKGFKRFENLPISEQNRINELVNLYEKIKDPQTKSEFNKNYVALMNHPLVVTLFESPFLALDADVYRTISSQDSKELVKDIMDLKANAQKELEKSYHEKIAYIEQVYSEKEEYDRNNQETSGLGR